MKSKYSDNYNFLILLAISIVATYFLPREVANIWYWSLFMVFMVSPKKYNHLFIIFFLFLFSSPGYLFDKLGIYKLPSLTFLGFNREIYFNEIFSIGIIIKSLFSTIKNRTFYYKPFLFIIGFSVFLLFYGFVIGMNATTLLKTIRYILPIFLIICLPKIILYENVIKTISLMFFVTFFLMGAQIFDVFVGKPIAIFLGEKTLMFAGREVSEFSEFDVTTHTLRTVYGPLILFTSLILSLAFLSQNTSVFKKRYLTAISFISFISIFLSATRGLIIALLVILLGFAIEHWKKFQRFFFIGLFFIGFIMLFPRINKQVENTFQRLLTISNLIEGDLTAGGTLSRLTERGPAVMQKFRESPFLGFGFSEEYYQHADIHVGNQTLLLNGGILGFLVYFLFLFSVERRYLNDFFRKKNKSMLMFFFGLLSIVIIHSTSSIVFSFAMQAEIALGLGLFFYFTDYFIKQYSEIQYENNSHSQLSV